MSKFRIIKTRINSKDALFAATSIASIVSDVADMAQFIPARAAASIVLVILQTVQEIDNNKIACYKLARRSAKILVELKNRMTGRWDSAPTALIGNILEFEKILVCIRDFMVNLTKVKWMSRLLQKASIENALQDYHELLDEAERTFQTASLVEIHYTVGILQERSVGRIIEFVDTTAENKSEDLPLSPSSTLDFDDAKHNNQSTQAGALKEESPDKAAFLQASPSTIDEETKKVPIDEPEELQLQEELKELERFGFKKYHQTDLRLLSEVKTRNSGPFWQENMVADSGGQRVLVKRYEGAVDKSKNDLSRWIHDIKTLRNLFHPNLPQLIGYSDERSIVPFILLSQTKLRDPSSLLLNSLRTMSIADCAIVTLKIYRDISSAALYVQQQLSFDERETQEFIAETSYTFDTQSGKIIVGIPTPKNHFRGFGYRLTESLLSTTMQIVPDCESIGKEQSTAIVGLQDKLAHVRALARVLLPSIDQKPTLTESSEALLEESDFEEGDLPRPSLSLSRIRSQSIRAGTHEFAWHTSMHSCPISFSVGDIGYISHSQGRMPLTDKSRFDHFVKIGNVFDALVDCGSLNHLAGLSIIREVSGTQSQWNNGFNGSNEIMPFVLPDKIEGWTIALPSRSELNVNVRHSAQMTSISNAWGYLLREAESLADAVNIRPHEIILITKSTLGHMYRVRDCRPPPPPTLNRQMPSAFHRPHFNQGFGYQPELPSILYLFTSYLPEFTPFLSETPTISPRRGNIPNHISLSSVWFRPEAYVGYIQLSEEDFLSQ